LSRLAAPKWQLQPRWAADPNNKEKIPPPCGEAPLALDKRAREKHPSYWTDILGGNDGVLTGQSMKVTMYGWFKRRVAEVAAED